METVKTVMKSLGVLPKLRLGIKLKGGGVKSTGTKHVKFLSEPEGITGKNFEGKATKFLRFEVEHNGTRYHWFAAVLNREGQPNYLLERLAEIQIGDERDLEMTKQGARNYIDIRDVNAPATAPEADEGEDDDDSMVSGLKDIAKRKSDYTPMDESNDSHGLDI
jgi:hypothetical protein